MRFQPPFMGRLFRLTFRSLCSSAWWENQTQSSSCNDISATGTYLPVSWQVDWPKRMRAMSRIAGCSSHPESVTRRVTSTGAPQYWQV